MSSRAFEYHSADHACHHCLVTSDTCIRGKCHPQATRKCVHGNLTTAKAPPDSRGFVGLDRWGHSDSQTQFQRRPSATTDANVFGDILYTGPESASGSQSSGSSATGTAFHGYCQEWVQAGMVQELLELAMQSTILCAGTTEDSSAWTGRCPRRRWRGKKTEKRR